MPKSIPYGFCHCGCGQKTRISTQNHTKNGWTKGEPLRFIHRHARRRWSADCIAHPTDPSAVLIPLSRGRFAAIDLIDIDLANVTWSLASQGYAKRSGNVYLHRAILERVIGRALEPGEECDHENQDKLDMRRSNLRLADRSGQIRNISIFGRGPASGFRGVYMHRKSGRYGARIYLNRRVVSLGYFDDPAEAARVRDAAVREHYGDFAILNFPNSGERGHGS